MQNGSPVHAEYNINRSFRRYEAVTYLMSSTICTFVISTMFAVRECVFSDAAPNALWKPLRGIDFSRSGQMFQPLKVDLWG